MLRSVLNSLSVKTQEIIFLTVTYNLHATSLTYTQLAAKRLRDCLTRRCFDTCLSDISVICLHLNIYSYSLSVLMR